MEPVRARLRELVADDRVTVLENTRFDPRRDEERSGFARGARRRLRPYVQGRVRLGAPRARVDRGVAAPPARVRGAAARAGAGAPRQAARRRRASVRPRLGRREGGRQARRAAAPRRPRRHRDRRRQDGGAACATRTRSRSRSCCRSTSSPRRRSRRTPRRGSRRTTRCPDGWLGLDIGPETRSASPREIARAKTVFWNGPMGVFEWPRFAEGTHAVARAVADSAGFTVVGGGDSVRALVEAGLVDRVSWVSTGGGAVARAARGQGAPGRRRDPGRMTTDARSRRCRSRAALGVEIEARRPRRCAAALAWAPERCTAGGILHGGALMASPTASAASARTSTSRRRDRHGDGRVEDELLPRRPRGAGHGRLAPAPRRPHVDRRRDRPPRRRGPPRRAGDADAGRARAPRIGRC